MKIPHNCVLYNKTCYLLYAFGSSVKRVIDPIFWHLALSILEHIQINRRYLRLIVDRDLKGEYNVRTSYE
jgi:hypothetical protein